MTEQKKITDSLSFRPCLPKRPETDRIAKLPVWAREYLEDVERAAEGAIRTWEDQVNLQQESRAIVGDTHKNPIFLPDDGVQRVRFDLTPQEMIGQGGRQIDWIDCTLKSDPCDDTKLYVEVTSRGGITVTPQVTNVIRVNHTNR